MSDIEKVRGEPASSPGKALGASADKAASFSWRLWARRFVCSVTRRRGGPGAGSPAQWQRPRMWICVGPRDPSTTKPSRDSRQHKRVVTTAGDHDISCRVTAATTTKTYRAASEFATKLRAAVSFGAFRISIPPPPPETTRYASGSPRAGEHSAPVVAIARARPRHLFLVRPTQRAGP